MTVENLTETMNFSELRIGEAFTIPSEVTSLCMKIEEVTQTYPAKEKGAPPEILKWNAVDLGSGELEFFFSNSIVIPCPNAKVTYFT